MPLAPTEVIDRQPLFSQRGNFSGKPSVQQRSWLPTEWWFNSPTTGKFDTVMERTDQFHVPMGWVDLAIASKPVGNYVPSSLGPNFHGGTLVPRTPNRPMPSQHESGPAFYKVFLWRTDKELSKTPFSTIPTKY